MAVGPFHHKLATFRAKCAVRAGSHRRQLTRPETGGVAVHLPSRSEVVSGLLKRTAHKPRHVEQTHRPAGHHPAGHGRSRGPSRYYKRQPENQQAKEQATQPLFHRVEIEKSMMAMAQGVTAASRQYR